MTSGGSRRRECPASAKKPTRSPTGAVCRSGTRPPVHSRASPPEGKAVRLSRLSYPAPAPCRSGSKGEAPWSPEAKSRMPCSLNGEGVEDFLKSVFFCETGLQNVVQAVILRVLVPQYGGFMVISSGLGIRGRVPMRRIITWLLSYR